MCFTTVNVFGWKMLNYEMFPSGDPTSDSVYFSDDCPSSASPTRRPGTGGRGTPTGELWLVDGVNAELWLAAAPRWCWSWWSRCSWRWSFRCPPWPRCTPSPPGQGSSSTAGWPHVPCLQRPQRLPGLQPGGQHHSLHQRDHLPLLPPQLRHLLRHVTVSHTWHSDIDPLKAIVVALSKLGSYHSWLTLSLSLQPVPHDLPRAVRGAAAELLRGARADRRPGPRPHHHRTQQEQVLLRTCKWELATNFREVLSIDYLWSLC